MKGILFKEPLFKAIIDGRKTQTRRVIKDIDSDYKLIDITNGATFKKGDCIKHIHPRYRTGEVVYMKEPFVANVNGDVIEVYHKYMEPVVSHWKNKLFMPAKYARYFIKIEKVIVQRLQDISEKDAISEQCFLNDAKHVAKLGFFKYWDHINKPPYSYNDNPYVFAYTFNLYSPSYFERPKADQKIKFVNLPF